MKTKEEIQSLIDGKIKGQGSAIDIGGALPEILGSLNEIANDAVGPNSTDLDEETQMQVRKNLGLYYDLTKTEEKTAEYTDQEFVNYWAKISDDTPAKDDLIGVEKLDGELLPMTDFTVDDMAPDAENGYTVSVSINTKFMIYFKEADGRTPGIYIANTAAETYKGLKWQEVIPDKQGVPDEYIIPDTEDGKMQMRKGLGLYYEETSIGEKTAQYTDQEWTQEMTCCLSTDTPSEDEIIDVTMNGSHVDYEITPVANGLTISTGNPYMEFRVVFESSLPSFPSAGIWLEGTYQDMEDFALVYSGVTTVISKVPEKFLPPVPVPDEVEGNPTVPGGTSPTPLENLRINEEYFSIPQGGGGTTPILATGLPDTSITTIAALDALGYTATEIQAASQGQRNGVSIDYGSSGVYFVVITNVTYVSNEQYSFDLICGASYVIDVSVGSGSVIVTES